MERQQQIAAWLDEKSALTGRRFTLTPASADASFRRYFRVTLEDGAADGGQTLIVMDAPPTNEDCRPWLRVRQLFADAGAHVPAVLAEDLTRGFLLLSDLGSATYLSTLTANNAPALYGDAVAALLKIQQASRPGVLPDYDESLLRRELDLFPEWYLGRHHGLALSDAERAALEQTFARILAVNLAEPRVFVHRDYHSRNLMHLATGDNPGIIDFQDAVYGPLSYDLVSLFRDAYIAWDEELTLDWLIRYWEKARAASLPIAADFANFYRDYEWMGVQRQLKVLGIFARLYHRDGKAGYLADLPRVENYLRHTCARYAALTPILQLLDRAAGQTPQAGYTF